MAKRKPLKPIMITPPPIAAPAVVPPQPMIAAADLRLVAQLAQDGLTALLKEGAPLERLASHAAALIGLQRALNVGNQSAAAAAKPA